MPVADVFIFNPVPKEKAFANAIAEIRDGGKLVNRGVAGAGRMANELDS